MTELLTTNQVQDLLQVDRTTIYRMVEDGRLPGIRVGKQWRFQRSEIAHWLQTQNTQQNLVPSPIPETTPPAAELRAVLPLACVQLIQDAFADILGVMLIVTDMHGQPITQPSHVCGFHQVLIQHMEMAEVCANSWQHFAASPSLVPHYVADETGLLCARGLIHLDHAIAGMLIMGAIAPETWPPTTTDLTQLAATLHVPQEAMQAHAHEVYHLDPRDHERALRHVQRIADIFSHIARDRNAICGKLQAIASLTHW